MDMKADLKSGKKIITKDKIYKTAFYISGLTSSQKLFLLVEEWTSFLARLLRTKLIMGLYKNGSESDRYNFGGEQHPRITNLLTKSMRDDRKYT